MLSLILALLDHGNKPVWLVPPDGSDHPHLMIYGYEAKRNAHLGRVAATRLVTTHINLHGLPCFADGETRDIPHRDFVVERVHYPNCKLPAYRYYPKCDWNWL